MNLDVNGQSVLFSLDTGAEVTVLTYTTFCSLELPLADANFILAGADGRSLTVCGAVDIKIKGKNKSTTCLAYVVKGASRNLLCVDQIIDLGLLVINDLVCEKAFDAFQCFPRLSNVLGTKPGVHSTSLNLDIVPLNLYACESIAAGASCASVVREADSVGECVGGLLRNISAQEEREAVSKPEVVSLQQMFTEEGKRLMEERAEAERQEPQIAELAEAMGAETTYEDGQSWVKAADVGHPTDMSTSCPTSEVAVSDRVCDVSLRANASTSQLTSEVTVEGDRCEDKSDGDSSMDIEELPFAGSVKKDPDKPDRSQESVPTVPTEVSEGGLRV